jgi:hypothetical protein
MVAFTGSADGAQYVTDNTFWNTGGWIMGGTNGCANGIHFLDFRISNGTNTSYGINFVENAGNTYSDFAEPNVVSWNRSISTPIMTPAPTPAAATFGLEAKISPGFRREISKVTKI